jgi:hypothetical protein
MGVSAGPNIIRDSSLVLELDAADRNSYVSGSTIWRDVSANNNSGSLVNGPTFSSASLGSIVFDGSDDYISTTYNAALTDFTVCIWFKADGTTPAAGRLLDKDYISGFWLGKNVSGVTNSWGGGIRESSTPYGIYITLIDGQWNFLTSTRLGTTHTLYGNGITNINSNTVSSTVINTSNLWFGMENNLGPSRYRGNIANTLIYNRALSPEEILQNYNALKSRFGLK